MKKFILILVCSLFALVGKSQISIYGGFSDLRSPEYSYTCPTVGLSLDRFYVSAVANFKNDVPWAFTRTHYNVYGGTVGYKLYITKKLKIIPNIGVMYAKRIHKGPISGNIFYSAPIHRTNYGVMFQRSLNKRFELAIGTHSIEKLKVCLVYNLKINPIINEK